MGRMVELEAKKLSIPISKIINSHTELSSATFDKDEIAIEFTEPSICLKNIKTLSSKGVKIVCGTTGWDKNINEVKEIVKKHNTGFIYASNFSIGVNIFWRIIEEASSIINKFDNYDIMGHEIHHNKKKDSPSGTALTTANVIINKVARKKHIVTNKIDGEIKASELHFSSSRCGNIIGKHEVIFDSPTDSISISHDSKDRSSYAIGAINCAKWIKNKTGFYSIKNYMEELLNE